MARAMVSRGTMIRAAVIRATMPGAVIRPAVRIMMRTGGRRRPVVMVVRTIVVITVIIISVINQDAAAHESCRCHGYDRCFNKFDHFNPSDSEKLQPCCRTLWYFAHHCRFYCIT